jgi:cyclopropane-fatty-acyl-phospholipid synthase
MATITTNGTEATVRFLQKLFPDSPPSNVRFRLWDGTTWPDQNIRPATIALKHPGALRRMFERGTEKALAEAFLRDDFDVEGDLEAAFELTEVLRQEAPRGLPAVLRNYYHLKRLPAVPASDDLRRARPSGTSENSLAGDRRDVSFHYDVSNDFYELWLDRRMVYSCAYFEDPELGLDEAQEAKLRHICRKLRLRPGQRLLDIGCGWGGLATFAAHHFGVRVTGVTLSERQCALASTRVRAAGLDGAVEIMLKDYRELDDSEPFDALVSVGMSEHVRQGQLPGYFKTCARLLRPGGVFLNHAIGEGVRRRQRVGPSFIEEYVFPGTHIAPISEVAPAAESAGLEIRDVENLREHYARTLRHWVRRLENAHAEALELVSESTYRIWRLYMAASARGFERGELAIYQTLLSKPDSSGHAHLPLTRRDWYRDVDSFPALSTGKRG